MDIQVELAEISTAAANLEYFTGSMQNLARRLYEVATKIYSCYDRGGTGYRAGCALKSMGDQINELKKRAAVLNRAVEIYNGEDEKQKSKGKKTVSTVETGYDAEWTKRPAVEAITATTATIVNAMLKSALSVSTVIAGTVAATVIGVISGKGKDGATIQPASNGDQSASETNAAIDAELEAEAQEIAKSLDASDKDLGTPPPFLSNQDSKKWESGCFVNSYAMIFQYKGKNVTRDQIYSDNGNTVTCRYYPDGMIKAYGFTPEKAVDFPSNQSDQEKYLKQLLKTEGAVILEMPGHMAVAYIDSNGDVRVQDPGMKSKEMVEKIKQEKGTIFWCGEENTYSEFLGHWNGKKVTSVWCVHS